MAGEERSWFYNFALPLKEHLRSSRNKSIELEEVLSIESSLKKETEKDRIIFSEVPTYILEKVLNDIFKTSQEDMKPLSEFSKEDLIIGSEILTEYGEGILTDVITDPNGDIKGITVSLKEGGEKNLPMSTKIKILKKKSRLNTGEYVLMQEFVGKIVGRKMEVDNNYVYDIDSHGTLYNNVPENDLMRIELKPMEVNAVVRHYANPSIIAKVAKKIDGEIFLEMLDHSIIRYPEDKCPFVNF